MTTLANLLESWDVLLGVALVLLVPLWIAQFLFEAVMTTLARHRATSTRRARP